MAITMKSIRSVWWFSIKLISKVDVLTAEGERALSWIRTTPFVSSP